MAKEEKSYWIAYLLPFDQLDRNKESVPIYVNEKATDDSHSIEDYQKKCIHEKIFGMGWPVEYCSETDYPQKVHVKYGKKEVEKISKYYKLFTGNDFDGSKVDGHLKKDDLVMMRLRDGHYYIGKVTESGCYLHTGDTPYCELSFGAKVDRWYEIQNELDVPGRVRGRFSQMFHPTLQRVNDQDLISIFNSIFTYESTKLSSSPKMPERKALKKSSFAKDLDYRELEDLVYFYMLDCNNEYRLLPSSCKRNQMKYEFWLYDQNNGPSCLTTCQVKNQANVFPKPEDFMADKDNNAIKSIYCFNGRWNDNDARDYQEHAEEIGLLKLKAIKPSELFQTLKKHRDFFETTYYKIED